MNARLIGPSLMVAMGVALLVGPAQTSVVDVGTPGPCIPISEGAAVGVVDPCDPCLTLRQDGVGVVDPCDPCTTVGQGAPGFVDPCIPTTEAPPVTVDPCEVFPAAVGAVAPCVTTTTETEITEPSTVPETTSTTAGAVAPADTSATTTTAPAVAARRELARTGDDNLPLTGAAIGLIVAGVGLAVAERRHQVRRNRA